LRSMASTAAASPSAISARARSPARSASLPAPSGPGAPVASTRRAIAAAATNTLESQLEIESGFQRQAGHAPDFAEGVRAFLEKRPPVFTGRGA
jgi:enoyl-CoA hydratase/carnithine racemase